MAWPRRSLTMFTDTPAPRRSAACTCRRECSLNPGRLSTLSGERGKTSASAGSVLDGELVLLDGTGRPQFERLRRRLALKRSSAIAHASQTEPAAIFAFDLLAFKGEDYGNTPYRCARRS